MTTYFVAGCLAFALLGLPYCIYVAVRPSSPPAERGIAVLVSLSLALGAIGLVIGLLLLP